MQNLYNFNSEEAIRKQIVEELNLAKSYIRHTLGQRIEMRRVPEMTFKDDTVLEKGLSVLKLLAELKNKNHNQDSKVEGNNNNG